MSSHVVVSNTVSSGPGCCYLFFCPLCAFCDVEGCSCGTLLCCLFCPAWPITGLLACTCCKPRSKIHHSTIVAQPAYQSLPQSPQQSPYPVQQPVPNQQYPVQQPVPNQQYPGQQPVPNQQYPVQQPVPNQQYPGQQPVPTQQYPMQAVPNQQYPVQQPAPPQPYPAQQPAATAPSQPNQQYPAQPCADFVE